MIIKLLPDGCRASGALRGGRAGILSSGKGGVTHPSPTFSLDEGGGPDEQGLPQDGVVGAEDPLQDPRGVGAVEHLQGHRPCGTRRGKGGWDQCHSNPRLIAREEGHRFQLRELKVGGFEADPHFISIQRLKPRALVA